MITSLLEPCLIIPNYAARHLVHSVSRTMQPEQQLARCSVCVQSPWYHQWACSHLSRLQRWDLCCCINNTAWYCPGGSLLCVSGSCLFSLICYAVYPNTERGAFPALHGADAATRRDDLHLLWERDAHVTQGAKESACIYTFRLKSSECSHAGVGFHRSRTHTPRADSWREDLKNWNFTSQKLHDFRFVQSVQFGHAKHHHVCNLNSKVTPRLVLWPPGKGVTRLIFGFG